MLVKLKRAKKVFQDKLFTVHTEPADARRGHSMHLARDAGRVVFQQGCVLWFYDPFRWNWNKIKSVAAFFFFFFSDKKKMKTDLERVTRRCDWPLWPNYGPCKCRHHCVRLLVSWKWVNCGIRPFAFQHLNWQRWAGRLSSSWLW